MEFTSTEPPLTCVICGCTKEVDFFDGWRACIGAPGLSDKVDIDRPECDHCADVAEMLTKLTALAKQNAESIATIIELLKRRS